MKARPFQKLYELGLINFAQEELANASLSQDDCYTEPDSDEPKDLNTLKGINQSRRTE